MRVAVVRAALALGGVYAAALADGWQPSIACAAPAPRPSGASPRPAWYDGRRAGTRSPGRRLVEKHHILTLLGVLLLLVGIPLYSTPDPWNRSWGTVAIQGGAIFFAAGLAAWAVVDAVRRRDR